MDELNESIKKFIEICDLNGVRGTYEKRNSEWSIELPSSGEIDYYFDKFNPCNSKIESGISPIRLFNSSQLMNAQIGYRWRKQGEDFNRLPKWPESYLVIGDDFGGGKPIVAVTNMAKTPIFAGYDIKPPFRIADSMAQFFDAMSSLVAIVYGKYEIFEVSDDDDGLKSEFILDVKNSLLPILGEENYGKFFDYFYG